MMLNKFIPLHIRLFPNKADPFCPTYDDEFATATLKGGEIDAYLTRGEISIRNQQGRVDGIQKNWRNFLQNFLKLKWSQHMAGEKLRFSILNCLDHC